MNEQPTAEVLPSPPGGAVAATPAQRMGVWYLVLLGILFALVIAGGTVRITGSGLSIPEWPIIYYGPNHTKGSLLPPFTAAQWQTAYDTYHAEVVHKYSPGESLPLARVKREFWTEYTHRFIAAVFSIVFLAVIVRTYRQPEVRRRAGKLLAAAIGVLVLQIILGGTVVKTHTPALYVSFHLGTAFLFVAMIAWIAMKLLRNPVIAEAERPPLLAKTAWFVAALCFLQVFSGGLVAKTHAGKHFNTWPLMGERLIPANALWDQTYEPPIRNFVENIVLVQFLHRWFAFAVAAGVVYLIARCIRMPLSVAGRWSVRAVASVVIFQILLGILTLLKAVPVSLGILHLGTGLVLFLLLIVLAYEIGTNSGILAAEATLARSDEPGLEVRHQHA